MPPVSETAESASELQIDHARAVTLAQVENIVRLDGPLSDQRSDAQRLGHLAAHNICNRHADLPVTPHWLRRLGHGVVGAVSESSTSHSASPRSR